MPERAQRPQQQQRHHHPEQAAALGAQRHRHADRDHRAQAAHQLEHPAERVQAFFRKRLATLITASPSPPSSWRSRVSRSASAVSWSRPGSSLQVEAAAGGVQLQGADPIAALQRALADVGVLDAHPRNGNTVTPENALADHQAVRVEAVAQVPEPGAGQPPGQAEHQQRPAQARQRQQRAGVQR